MKDGDKITAKETSTNKWCGLRHRLSSGYINLIDDKKVSFYMERGAQHGHSFFEACCSLQEFVMNFEPDPYGMNNYAYKKTVHHTRKYPDDFKI